VGRLLDPVLALIEQVTGGHALPGTSVASTSGQGDGLAALLGATPATSAGGSR
jgi:hypothetical protein